MRIITAVITIIIFALSPARADIEAADKAFADGAYLAARTAYVVEAEKGNAHAMFRIAEMYWKGLGMQKNNERALNWYNRAAEAGHMEAAYQTATMFMDGDVVLTNYRKAASLFEIALDGGIYKAGLPLGRIYSTNATGKVDMPHAVEVLEKAVLDPSGGEHVREAAYFLSQIYIGDNHGLEKSEEISLKWREIAAENGHIAAMADVALRYYNGNGVQKDPEKAMRLMTVAAESGHAASQYNLGIFHYQGVGTDVNYGKALMWFIVAQNTDPSTDTGTIEQFKKSLTAEQVTAAEGQAARIIENISSESP
jgi:TPR repeat protein